MQLWLAGRSFDDEPWEVLGIYSSEELAVKRCKLYNDFVGPLDLDIDLPEETTGWLDSYYPLASDRDNYVSN